MRIVFCLFVDFHFHIQILIFLVVKQTVTTLIGLSAVAELVLEFGLLFKKDLYTGLLCQ